MADVPQLTDGVVILDAYVLADVEAHIAGEDEEHARRFGWHPERSTARTARSAILRWQRERSSLLPSSRPHDSASSESRPTSSRTMSLRGVS